MVKPELVTVGAAALVVRPAAERSGPLQHVSFPGAKPYPRLTGDLCRPAGKGRFPAVVLMHGCAGLSHGAEVIHSVEALLCGSGYATLVVDSLSPRQVPTVCRDYPIPSVDDRIGDALAAKKYLSSLAFVDPKRIGLVGWSHGANAALLTWTRESKERSKSPFAAVVTYYPGCGEYSRSEPGPVSSPLLILIGEADPVFPASSCQAFVTKWSSPTRDVSVKVYPNDMHAFDLVDLEAALDSHEQVVSLFGRILKKQ